MNALKQLESKFVEMIHLISGTVQQRRSHVNYYLGTCSQELQKDVKQDWCLEEQTTSGGI